MEDAAKEIYDSNLPSKKAKEGVMAGIKKLLDAGGYIDTASKAVRFFRLTGKEVEGFKPIVLDRMAVLLRACWISDALRDESTPAGRVGMVISARAFLAFGITYDEVLEALIPKRVTFEISAEGRTRAGETVSVLRQYVAAELARERREEATRSANGGRAYEAPEAAGRQEAGSER
jgi:hypothetical protein